MKEKLSVFGMTLEELNRSQFEEGTFCPIVQLAFFFFFFSFSNCVIIYIFKINYPFGGKIKVSSCAQETVASVVKDDFT